MKAKQLTHKQLTLRTYIHRYLNTYLPTYLPTYIPPSSLHHSYPSSSLLAFCAPSKSVSSLRSMPSSVPNGSASVEPTPRWPVVGTLMGGFTLTHTHSHSLTFTHTHSNSLTLTHIHSHSLTHSLTYLT